MRKILIPVVLVLLGVFFSSLYVVEEGTRAVVLRFNNMIALSEPGLHFKIPGIDKVSIIDAKIQNTSSAGNSGNGQKFITRGGKDLLVDYYVTWRVTDFNRYFESVAKGNSIDNILISKINDQLSSEINNLSVKEVISTFKAQIQLNDKLDESQKTIDSSIEQTNDLNANVVSRTNKIKNLQDLGIELIDVRIKQISFPADSNSIKSIYANMRHEQEIIAQDQRTQSAREADDLRTDAKLSATKILSEAEKQARIIKGEADAYVAQQYADAFNQDREFFSFIRSLSAYEKSFNRNDVIVISPDSDFFRYMKLTNKTNSK
ncbi:protease modulator HflC [Orbaceae bacterium ac157xtp]